MDTLQTTDPNLPKKYTYRPSKKNNLFMEYWTDPQSETFGNVYRSGLKAGFSPTYAKNMLNIAPKWLLTYIDRSEYTDNHVKVLLQKLMLNAPDSRSPDDTRLKAIEIYSKVTGLIDNKQGNTTNVIVQPILSGQSVQPPKQVKEDKEIIDLVD